MQPASGAQRLPPPLGPPPKQHTSPPEQSSGPSQVSVAPMQASGAVHVCVVIPPPKLTQQTSAAPHVVVPHATAAGPASAGVPASGGELVPPSSGELVPPSVGSTLPPASSPELDPESTITEPPASIDVSGPASDAGGRLASESAWYESLHATSASARTE
jgi:hypothetical protein